MFTTQTFGSLTELARKTCSDSHHRSVRQIGRPRSARDSIYRLFPIKGRTTKHRRHLSRAGSEERLRTASELYVEGQQLWSCPRAETDILWFCEAVNEYGDAMQASKKASMKTSCWPARSACLMPARCPAPRKSTNRE